MKKTRSIVFTIILILAISGISACSTSKNVAEDDSKTRDIAWLTKSLQNEGVYITERGFPNLSIPSVASSRLVLNDRDILDVYRFDRIGEAMSNAYTIANMNPHRDVYRKESLVVIRYSNRDSGLSQTLFQLLGHTL